MFACLPSATSHSGGGATISRDFREIQRVAARLLRVVTLCCRLRTDCGGTCEIYCLLVVRDATECFSRSYCLPPFPIDESDSWKPGDRVGCATGPERCLSSVFALDRIRHLRAEELSPVAFPCQCANIRGRKKNVPMPRVHCQPERTLLFT